MHASKALKACRKYYKEDKAIKDMTRFIGHELDQCQRVPTPQHLEPLIGTESMETHLSRYFRDGDFNALNECTSCRVAYDLIQQRKAARQRLGAAKRFITQIGKNHDAY